jgi:hypothetical protein
MAKRREAIIKILKVLNQKPLQKGDIRKKTKIKRRTEYENLKLAMQRKWIRLDDLGFYHITTLGKLHAESVNIPIDSFNFDVYTQVLGFLPIHSEMPKVNCIIEIEKPNNIKNMDEKTKAKIRFYTNDGLWLPENYTNLKASVACVADSLLDNVAKNKDLNTILDEEFRNKTNIFNYRDRQPGYDYRKRLRDLARTNFQIIIEYKGEEWVNKQNFENLEEYLEKRQERYDNYLKEIAKRQKINLTIDMID